MTRLIAVVLIACCLHAHGLAQTEGDPAEASLQMLEGELLARPCFDRVFEDILTETLDESAWKHLDERWEKQQSSSKRHQVLRGMLAERQGEFDAALKHYAAAKDDDWGAYHHARFLAFMGDTEGARAGLMAAAQAARHPWIFREAARGLGELILLRENTEAAEKHYAQLWDTHAGLEHRMALMEPLLTLRMKLGRGKDWLATLNPRLPTVVANLSEAETDQAVLWLLGASLAQAPRPNQDRTMATPPFYHTDHALLHWQPVPLVTPPWFDSFCKSPGTGRWHALLVRETLNRFKAGKAADLMASMLRQPMLDDAALEQVLVFAAEEGPDALVTTAALVRDRLREKPWLAARAMRTKTAEAGKVQQELAGKIFDNVRHPAWLFWSLLLRYQANEPPAALHDQALALWQQVRPGDRVSMNKRLVPDLYGTRPAPPAYSHVSERPGYAQPSSSPVWNLRGQDFVAAMVPRFAHGLQQLFTSGATTRTALFPPDDRFDLASFDRVETGLQVQAVLWQLRDRLGMTEKEFASQDATPVARALQVLVRGNEAEMCRFMSEERDLAAIPARWLLTLNHSIDDTSSQSEVELEPETTDAAEADVCKALHAQRPHWIMTALRLRAPLDRDKVPALTEQQRRELLVSCGPVIRHYPDDIMALRMENWRRLFGVTDEHGLALEIMEASKVLELHETPHPLWGLHWQPSLLRQRALLTRHPETLDAMSGSYIKGLLPQMASMPGDDFPAPFTNYFSLKLAQYLGFALVQPQPARTDELRAQAARHPFVTDLLASWEALRELPPYPRRRFTAYHMTPAEHLKVLQVLEKSSQVEGRLTLAVLRLHFGDSDGAKQIAAEMRCADEAVPMLVQTVQLATAPPPPPSLTGREPPRPETPNEEAITKATKIFAEATEKDSVEALAERLGWTNRRGIYEWLRKDARPEPAFARKASVMAELARLLHVPAAELKAAEELDMRLNPNDGLVWLRHALSLVKHEEDKAAVDIYIESVRRMDFSIHTAFSWSLDEPKRDWAERVAEAGAMDRLAEAYCTAMERSKPQEALSGAIRVFQILLTSKDVADQPERLRRVLEATLQHQRHLLLTGFRQLGEVAEKLEQRGLQEDATRVIRMILLGTWPERFKNSVDEGFTFDHGYPQQVYHAVCAWSSDHSEHEVSAQSDMALLFPKALRGGGVAEFVERLRLDAEARPRDEHIVSCAAVAQAMQGAAIEKVFPLADKLDPQARMRVAWRLCEIVRPSAKGLVPLAPALAQGVEAMFQDEYFREGGFYHFSLAQMLLPWLEKAGAEKEIRSLMPVVAKGLETVNLPTDLWNSWMDLAQRYPGTTLSDTATKAWTDQVKAVIAGNFGDESWYRSTTDDLCRRAAQGSGEQGRAFAVLAHDVWAAWMKTSADGGEPDSYHAMQVCDQLLAYGETEQLMVLASQIETLLRLGSGQQYEQLLERARAGLEFLRSPQRLALPRLRVEDLPQDETSARVRWELTTSALPDGGHAVLKHTPKKHHLKILAGVASDALRPVEEVPSIAASGFVEVKKLPPAGFAQGLVCDETGQFVSMGPVVPYSLRHPLLDSADGPGDMLPEWQDEWLQLFGRPVSKAVAVDPGMSVLVDRPSQTQPGTGQSPPRLCIIALDKDKKPIGGWDMAHLAAMQEHQLGEGRHPVLRMSDHYHLGPPGVRPPTRPSFIILTTGHPEDPAASAPQAQVRVFERREPPVQANLPELEHVLLAKVDFPIVSWQLCENHPRAVMSGGDQVVVFDTDAAPWKELLRLKDPEIAEGGGVFMLNADVACFHQMTPKDSSSTFTPHVWQLRCTGPGPLPTSLKDCPEIPLPQAAQLLQMSPQEDAAVFISLAPGLDALQLVWLDSAHKTLQLRVERAQRNTSQTETWPFAAWWPTGGKDVVIEDNGIQFQLSLTPEGLRSGKLTRGNATLATVPPGATPGQKLTHARWTLKGADILVEMNPQSGLPKQAWKLPGRYLGKPLWWERRHQSVLLQTSDNHLILVRPQDVKRDR